MKRLLAALLLSLLISPAARAQLPLIRLDRIQPLGGKTGSSIEIEVQGKDLDDLTGLHFDHPGLKAELLKDKKFKVAIDPGVPVGTHEVRAVGRFGISGARLFHVQNSLAEVKEAEPNDNLEKAQTVAVNCVVNGASDGNGDDFFRVPLKKGQRIVVDCHGYRLDSTIRAILSIAGSDGRLLQQSRPYYHRTDPLLDFVAPAEGDYLVRLHDMTFNGGLPYRLVLTDQPHVENVFPSALRPGEKAILTVWGRNLPGGVSTGKASIHDAPLEQAAFPFEAPKDSAMLSAFRSPIHLAAPALNARGLQRAAVPGAVNATSLAWADAPLVLDREVNDTREAAQKLELPAVIAGRFDKPGDADWYLFTAKANEAFTIDLLCERLDFPGDPFVLIVDSKGNDVATFDDHGVNFNALSQFNRDAVGVFKAPRDDTYFALVRERYNQGGPRYQYVLRMVKAAPDFYPVLIHETNPDPSCPLLFRGGAACVDICLNRRDYSGPVTLEAEGLPPGLNCAPTHFSPQAQTGVLVITAAADTPAWSGPFRVKAWALIDGKKIEREVRPAQRRWAIANNSAAVMLRQACLAVRGETAPYMIESPKEKQVVEVGKTLETKLSLRRHGDFSGKVQVTGLNLPPGFSLGTTDITGADASIKISVAGNVPPGDYTLHFRGDAQAPYSRDAKASSRPNVRVAIPSSAMQVSVSPVLKK